MSPSFKRNSNVFLNMHKCTLYERFYKILFSNQILRNKSVYITYYNFPNIDAIPEKAYFQLETCKCIHL